MVVWGLLFRSMTHSALRLFAMLFAALVVACATEPPLDVPREKKVRGPWRERVLVAHGAPVDVQDVAPPRGVVSVQLRRAVGELVGLSGEVTIELASGAIAFADGGSPAGALHCSVFRLPWAMTQPGATVHDEFLRPLHDLELVPSACVEFRTGKVMEFVVYTSPESNRIVAVGYAAKLDGSGGDPSSDDSWMITFEEPVEVHGQWTPSRVKLYRWSEGVGRYGEPLGSLECTIAPLETGAR